MPSGPGVGAVWEQGVAFCGARFAHAKMPHAGSFFLVCIGHFGAYVYKLRMVEKVTGTVLVNYFAC